MALLNIVDFNSFGGLGVAKPPPTTTANVFSQKPKHIINRNRFQIFCKRNLDGEPPNRTANVLSNKN